MSLTDTQYKTQFVEYVGNLKMAKEDREMYQSVFEKVYQKKLPLQ
jgi:hypothetical protein